MPTIFSRNCDYEHVLELFTNRPAQAESLLYNLEQAVGTIGLSVWATKAAFMCFNREEASSTFSGKPLNLVDIFVYLGSNISSTETNFNIRQVKSLIPTNRLSIKWKWDRFD